MIANLNRFILRRRPEWEEYEELLRRLEDDVSLRLDLDGIQRLRYLHESAAGDLMRIRSFAAEPETTAYLESLLARGFGFIHENRGFRGAFSLKKGFVRFAETVRGHKNAFWLVLLAFLLGATLGSLLIGFLFQTFFQQTSITLKLVCFTSTIIAVINMTYRQG